MSCETTLRCLEMHMGRPGRCKCAARNVLTSSGATLPGLELPRPLPLTYPIPAMSLLPMPLVCSSQAAKCAVSVWGPRCTACTGGGGEPRGFALALEVAKT